MSYFYYAKIFHVTKDKTFQQYLINPIFKLKMVFNLLIVNFNYIR